MNILISVGWDADFENRPSMKEIIFAIDEILIESVMSNESARKWWKTHFLIPRQVKKNIYFNCIEKSGT